MTSKYKLEKINLLLTNYRRHNAEKREFCRYRSV